MIRLSILGVAIVGLIGMLILNLRGGQPDPLALPCTVGACTSAVNPYSGKVEYFTCTKCGSETCWILRSNPCGR